MCQAIQTIADRAADRAANKARTATLLQSLKNLMNNMNLTAEQSMDILEIAENERNTLMQLLISM